MSSIRLIVIYIFLSAGIFVLTASNAYPNANVSPISLQRRDPFQIVFPATNFSQKNDRLAMRKQTSKKAKAANQKANISAEQITYKNQKAMASGNATVIYRDAVIKADTIIYDELNRTITASGNVDVTQKNSNLKGDYGTYNLDDGSAELINAYGSTDEVIQNDKKIQGKIYFWGEKITRDEKSTKIKNAVITTCDCPRPEIHYHITSEETEIIPGDKIIAYKSKLKFKEKTFLNYNRLELSLDKKKQSLIPTIGRNENDGWYLKKDLDFKLFNNPGIAHIDLYEKTGIGFGIKYPYSLLGGKIFGYLDYYDHTPASTAVITENLTNDQREMTIGEKELRNDLRYEIGNGYYAGFNLGSYDYQYPGELSSSWNNYYFYFGRSTENQSILLSQATTDYNTYTYQSKSLEFAQKLGEGWTWRVGGYNSGYAGSIDTNDSIWRYYTNLNYSNDFSEANLTYLRTNTSELYHLDKIPEINFMTKNLNIAGLPIKAAVSAGSYREEPSGLALNRGKFYIGLEPVSVAVGNYGKLDIGGGFQQTLCDDGSGRYVFSGETAYKHKITDNINLSLNYLFQSPKGHSPFIDDYVPSYSLFTVGAEIFNGDSWKFSISGGYDYLYDVRTSIITTLKLKPSEKFDWTLSAHYNANTHELPNLTSQLKVDLGNGFSIENWTLYDNINDRFTYLNIGITKETHDFVTKLLYRNQQKELWLQFYLKAFPEEPEIILPSPNHIISPNQ